MRPLLRSVLWGVLLVSICLAQLPDSYFRLTASPVCAKYTIASTALTSAATTQNVALFTLPAAAKLTQLTIKHSAAFAGTHIGSATFSGTGLNDATIGGTFSGASATSYRVQIDGAGTPDTFKWSNDGGSTWAATTVSVTGASQTLENGVTVTFAATTGHTSTDRWDFATTVLSAMTVSAGTSGTPTAYSAAQNVFQAPGSTVFLDSAAITGNKSADMDAHGVIARFTATGQNLGSGTATYLGAGSVDIWACYNPFP